VAKEPFISPFLSFLRKLASAKPGQESSFFKRFWTPASFVGATDKLGLSQSAIYELVKRLNPLRKEIDWDIEMIGDIRDTIRRWLVDRSIHYNNIYHLEGNLGSKPM
jgi:hypothetical protein